MTDDRQSSEPRRFQLGALLRAGDRPDSDGEAPIPPERLARLEAALGPGPRHRGRALLAGVVLATGVATAVLVVRLNAGGSDPPAMFEIADLALEPGAEGRTFVASGREGALRFRDGSEVLVAPGSRLRASVTDPARAQVTVLQGRARFRVRHHDRTDWRVHAGPFRVLVTGTAFSVNWMPEAARFQLEVTEGSVRIEGGGAGMGLPLVAGQSLTADGTSGDIRVWRGEEPALPAPPPAAPDPPSAAGPASSPPPVVSPPPDPSAAWASLLGRGDYRRILADADRMGIDQCLRACSDAARMALADAARYQGRWSLARRVLSTLAEGSPLGSETARAEYLLGQIAEGEGDRLAAARAYERCERVDGGGYAALALGRLMVVWVAAGDRPAARQAAARYLDRYPGGPHADQARALMGAGPGAGR